MIKYKNKLTKDLSTKYREIISKVLFSSNLQTETFCEDYGIGTT